MDFISFEHSGFRLKIEIIWRYDGTATAQLHNTERDVSQI